MSISKKLISQILTADSFLEYAFLRWILQPAVLTGIAPYVKPQYEAICQDGRSYKLDYAIIGQNLRIVIELDGFEFHSQKPAFTYDRLRQNDLQLAGWSILRFTYDSVRRDTLRCVYQLQSALQKDLLLCTWLVANPQVEIPDDMQPDPLYSLASAPIAFLPSKGSVAHSYFDTVRHKLNLKTLRSCQVEAFQALTNYFGSGGLNAACVMSVGAGKTALGVTACLGFTNLRALIITPSSVIRGTFDRAFDAQALGNVLVGLPGGPLISGHDYPQVLTLDRDDEPIKSVTREVLLKADVIITNFHSLGTGQGQDDLLGKLKPTDIDFILVDEAHIAASESYQRTFRHFSQAKTLLMSACFQRLDGKPIDADVVYRYRLVDSIAEGHAKKLRIRRFTPQTEETCYELIWPDGTCEEITSREALLEVIKEERKLAYITAKSETSIRKVMQAVKTALEQQTTLFYPVKPRVLFSALGKRHAEQIARVAEDFGIPCAYLHYSMSESRIKTIRARYEQDSGDLQGIVQLKMLGQGYDFPPITVVVPMRPYGSFGEFYQFIGRGIRVLQHSDIKPERQFLDVIYHAEMNLDEHIETIYGENDMDIKTIYQQPNLEINIEETDSHQDSSESITTQNHGDNRALDALVLFEHGNVEQRVVHDGQRVEQRKLEREREALAQKYAAYVKNNPKPLSFEEFVKIIKHLAH